MNTDPEHLTSIIDEHRALRERCYELARENNGLRMGTCAWLRNAINASELQLWYSGFDSIFVEGTTWTSQTKDHEYFCFTIPVEDL
jgi:hypothetical protein